MKLKIGDSVVFKKYENMTDEERVGISMNDFPEFGEVEKILSFTENIKIKGSSYIFSKQSIDHIISNSDANSFNPGEEVWVKTTVNVCYDDVIFLNPVERFANKDNLKKVKHETSERFIVKEHYYGMYIGKERKLVCNKDAAQGYASRGAAYQEASDMHLNSYDVIPYDN